MSTKNENKDSVKLPIKRTEANKLENILTSNAYNNILPARYLRKNEDNDVIETPEELLERLAKNISLGDVVYKIEEYNVELKANPTDIRINASKSKRQQLCEKYFEYGTELDDEKTTIPVTEENINAFSYDSIMPKLPEAIQDDIKETKNQFHELLFNLDFIPNSPTIMNAGDDHQQLSACFVLSPEDDIDDIYDKVKHGAKTFQSGGGLGYAFSKIRPYGDRVRTSGGIASGPISFMQAFDTMCENIAQGGVRRGAQMGIMRVDHPDIIQFLHAKDKDVSLAETLRLNDPDDFTHNSFGEALEEARELIEIDENGVEKVPKHLRNAAEGNLSNFNISVAITEPFMEAVKNDEDYTLYNPRTQEPYIVNQETKELYTWFDMEEYVEIGEPLEIPAKEIWTRITKGAWDNGEPGVVFIDRINEKHSYPIETPTSPPENIGNQASHRVYATNPCGEQPLKEGEACLHKNETILTQNGIRKIENFKQGTVASDSEITQITSEATIIPQGEKETVIIELDGKIPIRCTPDHEFYTQDGWKEAQNLELGEDKIKWMKNNPLTSSVDMSTEDSWEAFTLGWMHGDGWLTENSIGISFNKEDGDFEIKQKVLSYYHKLFGERKPLKDDSTSYQEQTESQKAYKKADELGFNYSRATERQLPGVFYELSENEQLAFLRGLFTADAGIGGKSNQQIQYATSSYKLADEIQRVLGSFGIQTRRYVTEFEDREDQIRISITKQSAKQFMKYIGIETTKKREQFNFDGPNYTDDEYLTVVSYTESEPEQVYDLNVPETNRFYANGMLVHNCNLGHLNLSTNVSKDTPDWRDFEKPHDTLEENVHAFLQESVDWDELDRRIKLATHFLDNVVTMSDFPIREFTETVRTNRKIGLGIMGLAQMYIQMGVKYGTEVSNEVIRQLMLYINHKSKEVSHDMATGKNGFAERGVFENWNDSKYANPVEYKEWFEQHVGENAENWEDGYKLRNHNTTTIAPTGTTSMVGNTTGGCEPIYNVAYYKNVTQDVQGDEMLVEFDDYFLRVLQENDIDVEKVKEEAKEQMENNSFDGVNSLETVPNKIGELFVTTGDLTARQHAEIQCAAQEGVDSAISKTINAPQDATPEDTAESFMYAYDNGAKGVTYYRDGTRSKQVLTIRKDNQELEEQLTDEHIKEYIEENEVTAEELGFELEQEPQANEMAIDKEEFGKITPIERPKRLHGPTEEVKTGYGDLFVNINELEDGIPFEVFANIGNSGGYTASFTESIAKLISLCLRSGIDPQEVVKQISGIRSPKVAWDEGDQVHSVPDGVALALQRYLDGYETEYNAEIVSQGEVEQKDDSDEITEEVKNDDKVSPIEKGENPECPSCSSLSLYYSEGCKTCESCGWSEC